MGVMEQSQAVPEPRSSSSGKVSALWLVCQRVPSHPAVSPLLTGGQGRDQITLGKDGTAVPLVLGHLRESKKVFEVLDPLCGHLLVGDESLHQRQGGIGDRNSVPLSQSQAATAVGTGALQASLSKEPCSPQGPEDAGICSLCLIQKCVVLGKAFWACCIRHLFYRVFRMGLNSGFPKRGKAGKWFPVVAG